MPTVAGITHIGIAIVLGVKGNGLAVWRKDRVRLYAFVDGEASGVGIVLIGHPQVFGIDKRDMCIADRRGMQ